MTRRHPPARKRRRLLWFSLTSLAVALLLLTDYLLHGPLTQADEAINAWVTSEQAAGWHLHEIGDALSVTGEAVVDVPVTVAACLLVMLWGDHFRALAMALAGLAAMLTIVGFKLAVNRPLPSEAWDFGKDLAFPSGHTMGATVTAGLLVFGVLEAWLRLKRVKAPRAHVWRALAWLGLVLIAIGTGIGRVLDQEHWLNDVLAAWAFSAAILGGMVLAIRMHRVARSPARRRVAA